MDASINVYSKKWKCPDGTSGFYIRIRSLGIKKISVDKIKKLSNLKQIVSDVLTGNPNIELKINSHIIYSPDQNVKRMDYEHPVTGKVSVYRTFKADKFPKSLRKFYHRY